LNHITLLLLPLLYMPSSTPQSLNPLDDPNYIHAWLCHWKQQFLLCKIWSLFIILEHPYIIPPPRLRNIVQAKLMAFHQTTFFSMTNQPTCAYLQTTLLLFISFIITSPFHITQTNTYYIQSFQIYKNMATQSISSKWDSKHVSKGMNKGMKWLKFYLNLDV
jgi:hypothetical protein